MRQAGGGRFIDILVWPRPSGRRGTVVALLLLLLVAVVGWLEVLALTGPDVSAVPARVGALARAGGCQPVAISPDSPIAQATVAAEDGQFFSDGPVDVGAVVRGGLGLITGQDSGGSTIDIQLAHLLYPSITEGVIGRAQRVAIAIRLDARYSKAAILTLYLNGAYLGSGYYGVVAASEGYFGVAPNALSWAQASLLAGMLQSPSALDPRTHLSEARARQHYVLTQAQADGLLSTPEAATVAAAPLDVLPGPRPHPCGG
jgi:membrane peptidoglycan carboxypeptidase